MIDLDTQRMSTPSLMSDALSKTAGLFGAELQLARLEIGEKIGMAVKSIVGIVAAAIFLIVAMILLLQGVVALLVERGWSGSTASFMVGAAVAVVAALAIVIALRNLSGAAMRPDRSLRQMQGDVSMIKEGVR